MVLTDHEDRHPIDKLLLEKGMSRSELARQSGVPVHTIEGWAVRRRPKPDVYQLLKVSKVLECHVEDLLEPDRYYADQAAREKSRQA